MKLCQLWQRSWERKHSFGIRGIPPPWGETNMMGQWPWCRHHRFRNLGSQIGNISGWSTRIWDNIQHINGIFVGSVQTTSAFFTSHIFAYQAWNLKPISSKKGRYFKMVSLSSLGSFPQFSSSVHKGRCFALPNPKTDHACDVTVTTNNKKAVLWPQRQKNPSQQRLEQHAGWRKIIKKWTRK